MHKIMEDGPTAQSPPESTIAVSSIRGGASEPDTSERPKKSRRTFLTQNACTRCRQKKSKCDGTRPVCGRCEKNGAECAYDVAQEGITRMQNLQQLLDKRNVDHERLVVLFNAFQRGSDDIATNLLARLRLGESIESLVTDIEAMGDPTDTRDSQDGSTHLFSWPSSPLDNSSFTSWSNRCGTEDRRASFASDSGINTPRLSTSFKAVDLTTPQSHSGTNTNGLVDGGFYQMQQQHEGYLNEKAPYFSYDSVTWQRDEGGNNETSPTTMSTDGSFHDESRQTSDASQVEPQFAVPRKPGRGGPARKTK